MKCALLLLMCLVFMAVMDSSDAGWVRLRRIRIRVRRIIPRIRVRRIIPRILPRVRISWRRTPPPPPPSTTPTGPLPNPIECLQQLINGINYWGCLFPPGPRPFSAPDKLSSLNDASEDEDEDDMELQPSVCPTWVLKDKKQCRFEPEVCTANCTGCDPTGVECPPGLDCPDNCCACVEGEVLKELLLEKEVTSLGGKDDDSETPDDQLDNDSFVPVSDGKKD